MIWNDFGWLKQRFDDWIFILVIKSQFLMVKCRALKVESSFLKVHFPITSDIFRSRLLLLLATLRAHAVSWQQRGQQRGPHRRPSSPCGSLGD